MRPREITQIGVPRGRPLELAVEAVRQAAAEYGLKKGAIRRSLRDVLANPELHKNDELFGEMACALIEEAEAQTGYRARAHPAPHRKWGGDFEPDAVEQLHNACNLPVAVRAALMPDAHVGYGLPIGGVLATENAVIPYAVGMDIACRMKMTVLDWPVATLQTKQPRLVDAIERQTSFGVGATFKDRRRHGVMDDDWSVSVMTRKHKDRAWAQLGTSGSGNHFVEFGILELVQPDFSLAAGRYLALLSHSGSRGVGGEIARHYSSLAMNLHPELPKQLRHLAWLDLNSEEGNEYWRAMELMGRYAAANHHLIHKHVAEHLGAQVLAEVENHHNFAWKERHFGQNVVVHRKGATPATVETLGIIPGSMATPAYVVRGRGEVESLHSAAHGAGRRMSRKAAIKRYTWEDARRVLKKNGVTLLSAGLDEVPMAYKDIETVMEAQSDLVRVVARFDPKLVKMAPAGERPED